MKKMKKILAMLLALTMVMGMGLTSMAAISGSTIKVKGLSTAKDEDGNVATQTVKIYEIYRLDENNNLWVLSDWAEEANVLTSESDLSDPNKIELLAEKVPGTADATATTITGELTISKTTSGNPLQAGAYLVIATDTSNKTKYNPMVAVTYTYDDNGDDNDTNLLVPANASVTAKASEYTLGKEYVAGQDVVEVGDLVTYTIKTTVPYVTSDEATFNLTDTLEGATYYFTGAAVKGTAAKLEVKVGNTTVDTTEFVNDYNGESTFTLNLSNYVSKENTFAGKEVVITYTALVTAVNEITNKIESGYAEEITVKSWTGNAKITKYNADRSEKLAGATFVLYRLNNDIKEYAVLDANKYVTGTWVEDIEQAGTVVTDEDGVATVYGLDEGTYYFKETIAPDGYKVNPEPDDIAEVNVYKRTLEQGVVITGSAEMQNSKLVTLPSTGGIGTTMFYVAGGALVLAAVVLLVTRKRMSVEK